MINVNDYKGRTDSERIENAMAHLEKDGIIQIPPREDADGRTEWLIDRAIILNENTTVILQNCTIKLSDNCRDNFFRSGNCGLGIEDIKPMSNIHIIGVGQCVLKGADHPRATGDASKVLSCPCPKTKEDLCRLADWIPEERRTLDKITFNDEHYHSYGTDAGKENESQKGDWRGIGILLANVERFSIQNLRIIDSHGWGISCENCAYGRIEKIDFDACMARMIDGMLMNSENQDGIDIRNGCHDIIISDITGGTGDDVIALTAIASKQYYPSGSLCRTHVMHSDWTKREKDIHDIIIRNVSAFSKGNVCHHILLLPANGSKIYNVVIDGLVDVAPEGLCQGGGIKLGCGDGEYGFSTKEGMSNITISNCIFCSRRAIIVEGYIVDSCFSNIVNKNTNCPAINVLRKGGMKNVAVSNIISKGGEIVETNCLD